jgi:inosine/xanthosine triphosphate pyrophosphatase family protein
MTIPKLVVASTNAGKVKEFKEILKESSFEVISQSELEVEPAGIIETGRSPRTPQKSAFQPHNKFR